MHHQLVWADVVQFYVMRQAPLNDYLTLETFTWSILVLWFFKLLPYFPHSLHGYIQLPAFKKDNFLMQQLL